MKRKNDVIPPSEARVSAAKKNRDENPPKKITYKQYKQQLTTKYKQGILFNDWDEYLKTQNNAG